MLVCGGDVFNSVGLVNIATQIKIAHSLHRYKISLK